MNETLGKFPQCKQSCKHAPAQAQSITRSAA